MIEVLKQALEAWQTSVYGSDKHHKAMLLAMTKMNQAIAELESQEPVAVGEVVNERGEVDYISYVPPVGTALYTTPPAAQRQWVGLTDEERNAIEAATLDLHGVPKFFATAIEAKLKQKNGYVAQETNS